jgi:hypothetical protein
MFGRRQTCHTMVIFRSEFKMGITGKVLFIVAYSFLGAVALNAGTLSVDEARTTACLEAQRRNFIFETTCEDEFAIPAQETESEFYFFGLDASSDCGLEVIVDKVTQLATSSVDCE